MIILGLSQKSEHDPSAALMVDGKIAACVEQERLSRNKHAPGEAAKDSVAMCLKLAGLTINDIDLIAVPYSHENIRKFRFESFKRSLGRRGNKAWNILVKRNNKERRMIQAARQTVRDLGGNPENIPVLTVEHHLAHAASSFFFSGMESAALLTIDGEGELTTTLFGEADRKNGVRAFHEIPRPDSLGLFYSAMTEYLGFRRLDGEYKVMGMAPYGDPDKYDFSDIVSYGNGDFRINLKDVHVLRKDRYKGKYFSSRLIERFGPMRTGDGLAEPYIHVAATTQKTLEDVAIHLIEHHLADVLKKHDGRLCFAGGCALNVRLNRKLIAHPLISSLFVQPAAGDSGLSLGAAAYIAHKEGDIIEKMTHSYYGPEYSQEEIEAALRKTDLPWKTVDNPAETCAELLHQGHVVSWFQGRMEWGPRSLGNRSILGNPGKKGTSDLINSQIKFREIWRPFCPSILEEHAHDIVDSDHPSPFMTFTFMANDKWKEKVSEIVHVDGSMRPQYVNKESNSLYHDLIQRFHQKTGIPLIINTSLNRRGEPVVCTPEDSIAMFNGSGLTHMVMGRAFVVKDPKHLEI